MCSQIDCRFAPGPGGSVGRGAKEDQLHVGGVGYGLLAAGVQLPDDRLLRLIPLRQLLLLLQNRGSRAQPTQPLWLPGSDLLQAWCAHNISLNYRHQGKTLTSAFKRKE